ncbi:hypothetical protein SCB71_21145 (plasmid) [Herbiconiux sp. KACC 21604]|uniref:hypothetical protein n=1 Tax=unclassified Herbiconiux TaxID=2618217 RepID=UPI0014923A39|nr:MULTISPECIES: hypothetical protein [unclassified Herbiconiux]QJU56252.1 hypothetical protein HL652_20940 [Herbiconiux sp. SALV-R1]WPO88866.1 hypothetical protein SCB71_21145 [Herbiconiux sp. KACC 21604]
MIITDVTPELSDEFLLIPLRPGSGPPIEVPLRVVRHALESNQARATFQTTWNDRGALKPIFIKIIRDSITQGTLSSLAERERRAYQLLDERVPRRPHIAHCYAVIRWTAVLAGANSEPVTIFVLENLGPTIYELSRHRQLSVQLAGLLLRDGLAAVLELDEAGISSRDPHPKNFLLADPSATAESDLALQTVKLVDLGHAYIPGDGSIVTGGMLQALPAVQPPHVLAGQLPRRLVDDAFGVAMSAFSVVADGKTAYQRSPALSNRLVDIREVDATHWILADDYQWALADCDPDVAELITEIIEMGRTGQEIRDARAVVTNWMERAFSGSGGAEEHGFVAVPARSTNHTASSSAKKSTPVSSAKNWPLVTSDTKLTAPHTATHAPDRKKAQLEPEPQVTMAPISEAERDRSDGARKWLKSENIRHIAGRRDFWPKGLRPAPRVPRLLRPIAWSAAVAGAVVGVTLLLGQLMYSWFDILPATFETFADWQWWAVGIVAMTSAALAAASVAVLWVRFPRFAATVGLAVGLVTLIGGVGIAAVPAGAHLSDAHSTALSCDDSSGTEAVIGSTIYCVEDTLPTGWTADGAHVQATTTDDQGATVALDTTPDIGSDTGARIVVPFNYSLDCVTGYLLVYQTPEAPDWGHGWTSGDDSGTATEVSSGAGITRYAPGRNTWEVYDGYQEADGAYSGMRQYVMTASGASGQLSSTRAELRVYAADCNIASRPEIEDAGRALLGSLQLGPSETLDPSFVRVRDALATLSVPIQSGISPNYPYRWGGDDDDSQWRAGTELTLTTSSGSTRAQVWLQPLGGNAVSEAWADLPVDDPAESKRYKTFKIGDTDMMVVVFLQNPNALGTDGDALVTRLEDGIAVRKEATS